MNDHAAFNRRVVWEGRLRAETGLHIGAGRTSEIAASESPVLRDGLGRPFIPGSSFKGVLRSTVESTLRGLNPQSDPDRPWTCDLYDRQDGCGHRLVDWMKSREEEGGERTERDPLEWIVREACSVCRLFGLSGYAGRLRVEDLPVVGTVPDPELRNGVGIDRDKRTAASQILYEFEVVPVGTEFAFRLVVENPEELELGLVAAGLVALDEGLATVGGKGTRGLGRVSVIVDRRVELTPARVLAGETVAAPAAGEAAGSPADVLAEPLRLARNVLLGRDD